MIDSLEDYKKSFGADVQVISDKKKVVLSNKDKGLVVKLKFYIDESTVVEDDPIRIILRFRKIEGDTAPYYQLLHQIKTVVLHDFLAVDEEEEADDE